MALGSVWGIDWDQHVDLKNIDYYQDMNDQDMMRLGMNNRCIVMWLQLTSSRVRE